jgi:peptide/nickel transport system substrate-binding protein
MRFRPRATAAAAATALALVLTGCAGGHTTSASSVSGGTLTLGASVDIKSYDPSQAHIGHYVPFYQAVYDSLLRRKPDGSLVPMLAQKWSYNSTKTVLTLTLRKGVKFSDGTPLDGAAVKTNLDRFRTQNGPDASTLAQVSDVAAKSADTVVITLKAPDPALLSYLGNADGFIASPKAIDGGKIATKPVGSGPYTLDAANSVAGSKYTFVKSKNYWDPSLQVYDKVVIKPISDPTALLNALQSGQVNAGLLTAKTEKQAKGAGLTEYRYPTDWSGLLLLDRGGKLVPALKDVRVRQAINYAIDKEAMNKQINQGLGEVTSQVFGTANPGYDKALDSRYTYDPNKAKALLSEAGYGKGFTVTMPTSAFFDPAFQAPIGQNLKDVGITVNWKSISDNDYVADLVQGKFPASWFQLFQGSPWVAAKQMITPDATYNPFHTTDPKVESLVAKVQTGSETEQADAAKQLNAYIAEQAWFAPFYRPFQIYFTDKSTTVQPQAQQAVPSLYYYSPKK